MCTLVINVIINDISATPITFSKKVCETTATNLTKKAYEANFISCRSGGIFKNECLFWVIDRFYLSVGFLLAPFIINSSTKDEKKN